MILENCCFAIHQVFLPFFHQTEVVYGKNDKPTNGEFIALVADKLIIEDGRDTVTAGNVVNGL